MKSKKIFILSILTTFLISSIALSTTAAQEVFDNNRTQASDSSGIPDEGLIAPNPNDNATANDGEILYYATGENRTAVDDTYTSGAEDANLISTQDGIQQNNLIVSAIVVIVILLACAFGVTFYRRNKK